MAVTKLTKSLSRYKEQENEAKEAYKKENGLKIARGFKQSKEYKRINRNRKQFLYRKERKKIVKEVEEKKETGDWEEVFNIADNEIFHLVLSYNDKISRAIRVAFQEVKKQGQATGRRVAVHITFPDGQNSILESQVKIDMAFTKLYNMGLAAQKSTGDSGGMLVSATQVEGKEGYYFIIEGTYA